MVDLSSRGLLVLGGLAVIALLALRESGDNSLVDGEVTGRAESVDFEEGEAPEGEGVPISELV